MSLTAYKHTQISSTVPLPEDLCRLKKHKAKPLKISIDVNPSSGQQTTWKSPWDWFQNYHVFLSTSETKSQTFSQTSLKLLTRNCQTPSLWDCWGTLPPPKGFKKIKRADVLYLFSKYLLAFQCLKQQTRRRDCHQQTGESWGHHPGFWTKGQKLGGVKLEKPATTMWQYFKQHTDWDQNASLAALWQHHRQVIY